MLLSLGPIFSERLYVSVIISILTSETKSQYQTNNDGKITLDFDDGREWGGYKVDFNGLSITGLEESLYSFENVDQGTQDMIITELYTRRSFTLSVFIGYDTEVSSVTYNGQTYYQGDRFVALS